MAISPCHVSLEGLYCLLLSGIRDPLPMPPPPRRRESSALADHPHRRQMVVKNDIGKFASWHGLVENATEWNACVQNREDVHSGSIMQTIMN
uniref:Uncharacterized protein n=1 Tax=Oryza punctata TaxID=4537 RepID=A0A0E0JDT5_ORYPU